MRVLRIKIFIIFITLIFAGLTHIKCQLFLFNIISDLYEKNLIQPSIPKKIHYVWVGGPVPENIQKNIKDWQKKMPDYQIKRWDERNCNVNDNPFVREAYQKKEWRFVSDWCRLKALDKEGGIYLDTDMKINRSFISLLTEDLVLTNERKGRLSAGIIGVVKDHPFIKKIIDYYRAQTKFRDIPSPQIWTDVFLETKETLTSYKIYPSNVLMFNFKGGENRTEHLYNNGSMDDNTCSYWNVFFQKRFLSEYGICLKNCHNKIQFKEFLIPLRLKRYYTVKQNKNGCFEATNNKGLFTQTEKMDSLYFLTIKNTLNQQEKFVCLKNACVPYIK